MELFPEEGTFGNATVRENALLYNQVQEETDVQYTVGTTGIKEDIILNQWTGQHTFRYTFDGKGYEAEASANQILIREKGKEEILFVLSAPVMVDAGGQESRKLKFPWNGKRPLPGNHRRGRNMALQTDAHTR